MNNLLKGIIIGAGMILPGVSGGVLAVILGIYDKLIFSFNNLLKNKKENAMFLLPIIIGLIIGVIIFGKILVFVFEEYKVLCSFVFIGLILGSLPSLVKTTKKNGKIYINILLMSFILSLLLFVLGKSNFDFNIENSTGLVFYFKMFFTGILFISGKVIPGISSSFLLMLIGMYDYVLNIISNPLLLFGSKALDFIPFILGVVFGLIILIKLIHIALKKWYNITYSIIIGFVIGSLPAIYPGITFSLDGLLSIILLILGFSASHKLSSMSNNE